MCNPEQWAVGEMPRRRYAGSTPRAVRLPPRGARLLRWQAGSLTHCWVHLMQVESIAAEYGCRKRMDLPRMSRMVAARWGGGSGSGGGTRGLFGVGRRLDMTVRCSHAVWCRERAP